MKQPTPSAILPLACAAALLTACAHDNDRLTLGDGRGNDIILTFVQPEPPLTPATSPSVTGTDRSNWSETIAAVPMDRTDAHPCGSHYARRAALARHDARFPTPEEAVELRADGCRCAKTTTWVRTPPSSSVKAQP